MPPEMRARTDSGGRVAVRARTLRAQSSNRSLTGAPGQGPPCPVPPRPPPAGPNLPAEYKCSDCERRTSAPIQESLVRDQTSVTRDTRAERQEFFRSNIDRLQWRESGGVAGSKMTARIWNLQMVELQGAFNGLISEMGLRSQLGLMKCSSDNRLLERDVSTE